MTFIFEIEHQVYNEEQPINSDKVEIEADNIEEALRRVASMLRISDTARFIGFKIL